jgi:hypothetical protein
MIKSSSSAIRGSYDHSSEYDPFQSAANQMQELLFGSTSLIKPSSNSAFQKYVPSTADINSKMNAKPAPPAAASSMFSSMHSSGSHGDGYHSGSAVQPARASFASGIGSRLNGSSGSRNGNGISSTSSSSSSSNSANEAKVARFCHECGNPFALPSIRFCCECGVKRLYC